MVVSNVFVRYTPNTTHVFTAENFIFESWRGWQVPPLNGVELRCFLQCGDDVMQGVIVYGVQIDERREAV